jgi:hypothetical protein
MGLHLIWKRPDGFLGAMPEDFRKIPLSNGSQIWLHCKEQDWYPFQVNGDWASQEDTVKLNRLVNLLDSEESVFERLLERMYDDSVTEKLAQKDRSVPNFRSEIKEWLFSLLGACKGNTWEVEIMKCALSDVIAKIKQ